MRWRILDDKAVMKDPHSGAFSWIGQQRRTKKDGGVGFQIFKKQNASWRGGGGRARDPEAEGEPPHQ